MFELVRTYATIGIDGQLLIVECDSSGQMYYVNIAACKHFTVSPSI